MSPSHFGLALIARNQNMFSPVLSTVLYSATGRCITWCMQRPATGRALENPIPISMPVLATTTAKCAQSCGCHPDARKAIPGRELT
jgi:hypothetical protein